MLHIDMWAHKQVSLSCCRDMVVLLCCLFWGAVKLDAKFPRSAF